MRTLQTYKDLEASDKGAVIALGNFDGLHRGHQVVIAKAKSIADELNALLGIGLFRPHPYNYFKPAAPPFRLMSAELRAEIMPSLGVQRLYEIPFDNALREMDDVNFVERVLHQGLGIRHVVVGEDYGFGKDRCGDVQSLTRLCGARDIGVTSLKPVGLHKLYGKYGSTEIRKALKQGDVFHAAHMLSRPWIVDGVVQQGEQLGRKLGFPTANLALGDLVVPKLGIYCVETKLPDENIWRPSIASLGTRPTVDGEGVLLETFIFDFNQDIYGQHIQVRFRSFIRGEEKFDSLDALTAQMKKDEAGARSLFGLA